MVNYYAELGLDRGLDSEALKQELAKLRRKWQNRANAATKLEDQHKAENIVQMIREASDVLLDKDKRAKYDKKLDKDPVLSGQQVESTADEGASATSSILDDAQAIDALEIAYDKSHYNSAIAIANDLIKRGVGGERVYQLLASCYIETGRDNQAITTMQDMIRALPDDIEARYWAAFFDLRLLDGRAREARKHIDWLLQSEEGASARVAALDVEYYIDTKDFALAETKMEEYRKTVGRDIAFTKSVGLAYRQLAESYWSDYGGAVFFDSKEDLQSWKKYQELSLSIYPDSEAQSRFAENLKIVNGITFEKANFPGILFAFILGAIWCSPGTMGPGIICILLGVFITIFSFVPKWMAHKEGYTGVLGGPYLVARWASKIVGVVFNALIWIIKTIIQLIFSFM